MKIEFLPLAVFLAFYALWRFASPFLPKPTLRHRNPLARYLPLVCLVAAGALLGIALPNFSYVPLVIAVSFSIGIVFLAFVLAYRR